jgi:hypothetical protein
MDNGKLIDINFIRQMNRIYGATARLFGVIVESDAGYEARKRYLALSDAMLKYRREFLIYRIFEFLRLR